MDGARIFRYFPRHVHIAGICMCVGMALPIQKTYADPVMKAYQFADGSTEIAGSDGENFLCITRSSMKEGANNTVSIATDGKNAEFVLTSSDVTGADRNRNFEVKFMYDGKYYKGSMTRSESRRNIFRFSLPADAALAFLKSFNSTGHMEMFFVPMDAAGFPSMAEVEWKSFPTDMKHQEDCEESKGHVTGYINVIQ